MLTDFSNSIVEQLLKLLETAFREKFTNELRTTIPGYIIEFDSATQMATLQVGVQRIDLNGKTYTPPPIINCPLVIYGASGGLVEVEIAPDDECLIHFSMRCIDGWRQQGGVAPLVKYEKFREGDAFAVLAPRSSANYIQGYDNDGIKLRSLDGSKYVWIKNNGDIETQNDNGIFQLLANGNINANGATINTSGNMITADSADLNAVRDKLNELITAFNAHPHTSASPGSPTSAPTGTPITTL